MTKKRYTRQSCVKCKRRFTSANICCCDNGCQGPINGYGVSVEELTFHAPPCWCMKCCPNRELHLTQRSTTDASV